MPEAINGAFLMGGLIFSNYKFFAAGFAVVAIFVVWLFLERTPYGAIIKAGAHDSEMVRALGYRPVAGCGCLVFAFGRGAGGAGRHRSWRRSGGCGRMSGSTWSSRPS